MTILDYRAVRGLIGTKEAYIQESKQWNSLNERGSRARAGSAGSGARLFESVSTKLEWWTRSAGLGLRSAVIEKCEAGAIRKTERVLSSS